MFTRYILIFFIILSNSLFAANTVNNIKNTGVSNIKCDNSSINTKHLVKFSYTTFDYKMESNQFSKFLSDNHLNNQNLSLDKKEIIYSSTINNKQFNKLEQTLRKKFTTQSNVSSVCSINSCECGGIFTATSNQSAKKVDTQNGITFKIVEDVKNNTNAQLDYSYTNSTNPNTMDLVSINFTTFLSQILYKKYILITQVKKNQFIFGQIILLSFQS